MNKTLLKSVREYKKQSILAPILVILEVLMEVLIPMEMANIIDIGMTSGDLHYIIQRGVILVVMAMLSLFFGISAGNMAAVAGAGYAKNLRHDIFYKVQEFSFKNIDHFRTCHTYDNRYYKYPDGLYDEYPTTCQSTDHDHFIMGNDIKVQCESSDTIFDRDSITRRNIDLYCKKSTSTLYQSI